MTLNLLLDLDGTLLENELGTFLPAYTKALADHLAAYADPSLLMNALSSALLQMVENNRPDRTLEEAFDPYFYPAIGVEKDDLQMAIQQFYKQVFPTLGTLTNRRPQAIRLIQEAIQRGYRVGIATNPLFPRTAVLQRLEWAGLPVEAYPFTLIPSYETFHFSKPDPAFLAEFIAHLGWPEGPILVVGDDLSADIMPARRLGLPAFWLEHTDSPPPDGQHPPSASGALADIIPWLDSTPEESLQADFNSPPALLAILRSTPAALDSLARSLALPAWTRRIQPAEWTFSEILCHLRDVDAEVNIPRLKKVIEEPNPFLPGKDTDPWAAERQYFCQNGQEALHDFLTSRLQLLDLLVQISPEDWFRPARHAIFGPTHLQELVAIIVNHDRLHLQQIHQILKAGEPEAESN